MSNGIAAICCLGKYMLRVKDSDLVAVDLEGNETKLINNVSHIEIQDNTLVVYKEAAVEEISIDLRLVYE
jgi:hypothetical protein